MLFGSTKTTFVVAAMPRHNGAAFNHSCLRVPVNPVNKQPLPFYEQKYLNHLENQVRKLSLESNDPDMKIKACRDYDSDSLRSFIEFFDSIPKYEDVTHLSNRDFYRKLDHLKEKQRAYYEYVDDNLTCRNKSQSWLDDCKLRTSKENKLKSNLKSFCTTPIPSKSLKQEEDESLIFSDKDLLNKPPSGRSVRIESPSEKFSSENTPDLEYFRSKSRANISSAGSKGKTSCCNDSAWDDSMVEELKLDSHRETPLLTRSAPNSPLKSKPSVGWKDGITIPKPFQMTVRDEENKIIDEILVKNVKPQERKPEMFKAHDVPVESKIPLFDKIMAEQEKRRQKVKKKSKAALRAQMRPFSFTQKEEEMQNISRRLSRSTPSLFLDDPPFTCKQFKAKPVPRNLFSNYIYKKMHEDEFYRLLQKKIRAEEMFRAASLPPSMAKRERNRIKHAICSRALRDFEEEYHTGKKNHDVELEGFLKDYISGGCPKILRKSKKKRTKSCSSTTTSHTNTKSNRISSALSMDCFSRSNLAAILRAQSARKRLANDMCKKLDEVKWREEARLRENLMRKKPVWSMLAFSHEEDLAMRLQLRRDEEFLRNQENRQRMQNMLGRVNQQPTLFERQSHKKIPKFTSERYSRSPKDSESSERRFYVKDEAVQAKFDDCNDIYSEEDDSEEEKEKD